MTHMIDIVCSVAFDRLSRDPMYIGVYSSSSTYFGYTFMTLGTKLVRCNLWHYHSSLLLFFIDLLYVPLTNIAT